MSRLLTQSEVDALLASFEPEKDAAKAQSELPFDLRAPLLLAGERLALVQAACEKIATTFADAITLLLVAERPVRGVFSGLVQQPATTVLGTLAPGEPLGLLLDLHGEPVGGVSLHPELALALVDRLQGGEGYAQDGPRPLSPVESRLFESMLEKLVRFFDRETPLGPIRTGGLDSDPIFGRLASRGGTLATAQFRLATPVGDAVCRLLLTPVLTNRLVAEAPLRRDDETPAALVDALATVPIVLEPAITGATLRLADLSRLSPGSVVQLEVHEQDLLALRFNGSLLAQGGLRRQGHERMFEIRGLARNTRD
jgi:flagellar motor switch protein FliM